MPVSPTTPPPREPIADRIGNCTRSWYKFFNQIPQAIVTVAGGMVDPGANGIVVRFAPNLTVNRSIIGSARLSVVNGNGVAGPPTLDVNAGAINITTLAGTVADAQLPNVGTPGPYGDVQHTLSITTDTQGRVSAVTAVGLPVWLMGAFPGVPLANSVALLVAVREACTLPAGLTGSVGSAEVAAAAATVCRIYVNNIQKGTATFALGATTCTFTFAAPVVLAAGDLVKILMPNVPDANLATIAFALEANP